MTEFALYESLQISTAGTVDYDGAQVNYPATADTKSAYVELTASTAHDADGFFVHLTDTGSTTSGRVRLDVAVGAASAELVIVPDLYYGIGTRRPHAYHCPVPVPAGSRIAVRAASNSTNGNCRVHVNYYQGGFYTQPPLGIAETLGITVTGTSGIVVDPGATAGTRGAWTAIGTAPNGAQALLAHFSNPLSGTGGACTWAVDLSWGASRVPVYENFGVGCDSANNVTPRGTHLIPCDIPAGETIYMRAAASSATAGTRELNASVTVFA